MVEMTGSCTWALTLFTYLLYTVSGITCRDPVLQPFTSSSYWNTPIGSAANYTPAGAYGTGFLFDNFSPSNIHDDFEFHWPLNDSTTLMPFLEQGGWGTSAVNCFTNLTGPYQGVSLPWNPATMVTNQYQQENNPVAFVLPDARTVIEVQPLQQCPGWNVAAAHAYWFVGDIYGNGYMPGAHGGSRMSTSGGAIRAGELLNESDPIQHALKLEIFAQDWCYKSCLSNGTCTYPYNWPAYQQDGTPNGTNPYISWGSLLAIPKSRFNAVYNNMSTIPGKKILKALTDYGGYLVDDTHWNAGAVVMDISVHVELQQAYNITAHSWSSKSTGNSLLFYRDLLAIFKNLHVVTNNGPSSIGGGGNVTVSGPDELCPYNWNSTQKFLTSDLNGSWAPTWNIQTGAVNEAKNNASSIGSIFNVDSLLLFQSGGKFKTITSRLGRKVPANSSVYKFSLAFRYMNFNFGYGITNNQSVNCSLYAENIATGSSILIWSSGMMQPNLFTWSKVYWTNFSLVNVSVSNLSIPASTLGYNLKFVFNNYYTNLWMMLPINVSASWTTTSTPTPAPTTSATTSPTTKAPTRAPTSLSSPTTSTAPTRAPTSLSSPTTSTAPTPSTGTRAPTRAEGFKDQNVLYGTIGGGSAALLLVVGGAIFFVKRKRSDRIKLVDPMKTMTMTKTQTAGAGIQVVGGIENF
jgi:hypothetical protein